MVKNIVGAGKETLYHLWRRKGNSVSSLVQERKLCIIFGAGKETLYKMTKQSALEEHLIDNQTSSL